MSQTNEQQLPGFDLLLEAFAEKVADIIIERMEWAKPKDEDMLMTRQEVIDSLGISDGTLWRWEKEGIIKRSGTFGKRVYYKKSDVYGALEESKKH